MARDNVNDFKRKVETALMMWDEATEAIEVTASGHNWCRVLDGVSGHRYRITVEPDDAD